MLDTFEVITTGGVVLWSRKNVAIDESIIRAFLADTFANGIGIGDQLTSAVTSYLANQHTLKWTFVKELGLIFVAVYRSLLHLSWIDKFVENIKTIFVDLYGDQVKKPNNTYVRCQEFDKYFDQQIRELEKTGVQVDERTTDADFPLEDATISGNLGQPPLGGGLHQRHPSGGNGHTSTEHTPIATPNTSRPNTPGDASIEIPKPGPVQKLSRRARKKANATTAGAVSSGDEAPSRRQKQVKKAGKKGRKWDVDGFAIEDDDGDQKLDFSDYNKPNSDSEVEPMARSSAIDTIDSNWGSRNKDGRFVVKELDDDDAIRDQASSILKSAQEKKAASAAATELDSSTGLVGSSLGYLSSVFKNVVGGKVLTKQELEKAMKSMEDHLLKKNVAREAAVRLCDAVEKELIGAKTGSFESIHARIRAAMEEVLRKMLTPTNSLDLLREIDAVTNPPATSLRQRRPYVISIVGVNGVGKSTNLSKICYFLLQNKYKVLIAAGDTFRSGAVEQLGVHVRNLKELTSREGGQVELFQKGYGKNAANVAKDAVTYAAQKGYDVVLIDTAGRRHNDTRLMGDLEKFAKFANPDKILMVGEALVGSDSVAQARNFNAAFGAGRGLDGFIISKCDTVGDMVGALVSIVHATGVPVLFVGVGQHYSDIRSFSVRWAVEKLLSAGTN